MRAAESGLDLPIPSCPGWTMADLVWHLGEVHAFWGQVVAGKLTDWRDAGEVSALERLLARTALD